MAFMSLPSSSAIAAETAATNSGVTSDGAGATGEETAGAKPFFSVFRTTALITVTRAMIQIRPINTVQSPIKQTNKLE